MDKKFITVNGMRHFPSGQLSRPLLDYLRNELDLKATRFGCGQGLCGACTVLVDGQPVHACNTPLWSLLGKSISTVESLSESVVGRKLRNAFRDNGAAQCGYCVSGMMMKAFAYVRDNPGNRDENEIAVYMNGNLCRCGAHLRILKSIQDAVF